MPPRRPNYPEDRVKKLMIKVPKGQPKPVVFFVMTWAKGQVYVRIAYTDRADIRLADLSYASPFAKRLLFVLENCGKETEAWLHSTFHAERYWGSWFIASAYLLGFIEFLRSGQTADKPVETQLAIFNNQSDYDFEARKVPDLNKALALLNSMEPATGALKP